MNSTLFNNSKDIFHICATEHRVRVYVYIVVLIFTITWKVAISITDLEIKKTRSPEILITSPRLQRERQSWDSNPDLLSSKTNALSPPDCHPSGVTFLIHSSYSLKDFAWYFRYLVTCLIFFLINLIFLEGLSLIVIILTLPVTF